MEQYTKIQIRTDSSSNWYDANPVLALGEIGFESDTNKVKIGDGSSDFSNLDYLTKTDAEITAIYDEITTAITALATSFASDTSTLFSDVADLQQTAYNISVTTEYLDTLKADKSDVDAKYSELTTRIDDYARANNLTTEEIYNAIAVLRTYIDSKYSDSIEYVDNIKAEIEADFAELSGDVETIREYAIDKEVDNLTHYYDKDYIDLTSATKNEINTLSTSIDNRFTEVNNAIANTNNLIGNLSTILDEINGEII